MVATVSGALTTGSAWLWWGTLAVALAGGGHVAMLARIRRLMAERELSAGVPTRTSDVDRRLARFVAIWVLGVVLTPVVGLLRLVTGGRDDMGGHVVTGRLAQVQAYGRSQSLRVVAAGLVATTGVGLSVVAAGAAPQAAAASAGNRSAAGRGGGTGDETGRSVAATAAVAVADHLAATDLPNALDLPTAVDLPTALDPPTATDLRGADDVLTASDRAPAVAGRKPISHKTRRRAKKHVSQATLRARREAARAARAMRVAMAQVGKPYVYGAAGPDAFDCSGLTMYSYGAVGLALPHNAASQYDVTTHVSESQLIPGDLVFYYGSTPGHVAMYIGHGEVVSANSPGTYVQTQSINWDGVPTGFSMVV